MQDYLLELNESQRAAVINFEGPSLVVAGAGSGKTRVLTFRIAHLLQQGINANSIMALTFTNKAADEMKSRIAKIAGEDVARYLWMGTFHSIFARILRREAELLGYTSNFTIYDTSDSQNIIKKIIKDLQLDEKTYKASQVHHRISWAKNNLITAQTYGATPEIINADRRAKKDMLAEIYRHYAVRCKKADAMDFDDLLLNINILFRDFPLILQKYQNMFRYLLVDEYQDTNFAQYKIIHYLAYHHHNVCVVGDDAQSIYSFRGANIQNIFNFKKDYPECKIYKLEQNYRSTQTIVNAANSIIARNDKQIPKKLFSENSTGEKIKILSSATDHEEAYKIGRLIQRTVEQTNGNYFEHAILYRTNAQSRVFEEALRNLNVPYRIYGSLSFYDRKEIKDVLSYFRLTVNHNDDEAFKRIINYPVRGIGDTTLTRLEDYANQYNLPIWKVAENCDKLEININKGTAIKIKSFLQMIQSFSERMQTETPYNLAFLIVKESGILEDLNVENNFENIPRYENVEALLNSVQEFSDTMAGDGETATFEQYLASVSLQTGEDKENPEDRNRVKIMTIHAAKGLEFNYVYIAGVEEDLFPNRMTLSDIQEFEEERRLFYVAITRACKQVYLSYANERYKWGNITVCSPSRFIHEIDSQYIDSEENTKQNHRKTEKSWSFSTFNKSNQNKTVSEDLTFSPPKKLIKLNQAIKQNDQSPDEFNYDDPMTIQTGMLVEHQRFGQGKVINIEGTMPNSKATVFFPGEGQKQLLLKFAKLRIINETSK